MGGMSLLRVVALALLVTAPAFLIGSCVHPLPNPGAVVVSCTMDAVKDPAVIQAVMNALAKSDFASAIASLINPAIGVTGEVIACILHSYLGKLSADPQHPERYSRARSYLQDHGYGVP